MLSGQRKNFKRCIYHLSLLSATKMRWTIKEKGDEDLSPQGLRHLGSQSLPSFALSRQEFAAPLGYRRSKDVTLGKHYTAIENHYTLNFTPNFYPISTWQAVLPHFHPIAWPTITLG